MKRNSRLATFGGAALLVAVSLTFGSQDVTAADHLDAPETMADASVDLADYYVWEQGDNVVFAVTFGGPLMPGAESPYSPDTLYTFNIDTDLDGMPDESMYFRFGQNGAGEWGVQFNNVFGATDTTFDGPVDTDITNGDVTARAGLFDDPFFFDLTGFRATAMNLGDDGDPADLAFTPGDPPDDFTGMNELAFVVEVPAASLPAQSFTTWATASRIDDGGATGSSSGSGSGSGG